MPRADGPASAIAIRRHQVTVFVAKEWFQCAGGDYILVMQGSADNSPLRPVDAIPAPVACGGAGARAELAVASPPKWQIAQFPFVHRFKRGVR